MFQAVNILSGRGGVDDGGRCGSQIQECWEFEHPRRDVVLDERGKYFSLSELRGDETSPCPDAFTCFSQGYQ